MLNDIENTDELVTQLRRLKLKPPPADGWRRIRERARAEGLLRREESRVRAQRAQWYLVAGLAAAMFLGIALGTGEPPEADETLFATTPSPETAAVDALMRQSGLLEQALRLSPPPPRIVRVGLASREAAVEDRIAAIDQALLLNVGRLESGELVELWSERAAMMNTLIELRKAGSEPPML